MEQKNSNKVITKIILGQSIVSVRIITALFIVCATLTKFIYAKYLPELVDSDIARWTIVFIGALFFLSTFYTKPSVLIPYLSFFSYSLSIGYVVYFALVNQFDPSATAILILVMGAGTVIINSLVYYGIQSGIIVTASLIVFFNTPLSGENKIAFFNLLIAIGVFATVIFVRLRLRSRVGLSQSLLEKLRVLSIVADKKGEIVFVNATVQTLLGYRPSELLKDGWWETKNLSEGWISRDHIINYPNVIPKEIVNTESRIATKDGRFIWLSWLNSILPNGNYMGIGIDVTKYKQQS
jgi:PAS domain S-box-containing protein